MACYEKPDYNAKITETDYKTPRITGVAFVIVVNAFENKIPNVTNVVKKTSYNSKFLRH